MIEIARSTPNVSKRERKNIDRPFEKEIRAITDKHAPKLLHGKQLKNALHDAKLKKLKELNELAKASNPNAKEINKLSNSQIADVLLDSKVVKFTLFDEQEDGRVAMYLPDEGIYTVNYRRIYIVISYIDKALSEKESNDVIFQLKKRIGITEQTNEPHLIAVNNGIFNLKTKELEPFSDEYVFTTKIATNYIEDPPKPKWDVEHWLSTIANNDEDVRTLLWQVMNEALNGNYTRGKAFFLVGEGNNGKGTFQELISNLVGKGNVAALKVTQFEDRFQASTMVGKSLVIGDDVPPNTYIEDSSVFKSVITGDPIQIEVKHKQPYTMQMTPTVLQSTNGMPKFKDTSHGNLRRMVIIPFLANFNGQIEDRSIKDKHVKDREVLEYVLHKAIHLEFETFIQPKATENALESFKESNDPIYAFYVDVFKTFESELLPKRFVYEAYKMYCNTNGYRALGDRKFNESLFHHISNDYVDERQKLTKNRVSELIEDKEKLPFSFHISYLEPGKAFVMWRKV